MSQFIRHLNQIKKKRAVEWLTPSQQVACSSIKATMRIPTTVNLFGHPGVGKTFLSWTIASELDFTYLPHPDLISIISNAKHNGVIVDNCQADRQTHRKILKMMRFHNVDRVIIITRQIIKDYTQFVELKLTQPDIVTVQQNLVTIGVLPANIADTPTLWYLVNSSL
jgi:hypothetical protein